MAEENVHRNEMAVRRPRDEVPDLRSSRRLYISPNLTAASVREALSEGEINEGGERCPTCQDTIHSRFCSRCGAQSPGALPSSVWAFLRRAVSRVLDADNRLLRSLYTLLLKPGRLTAQYLKGNRVPYVGPVQLFALVNVFIVLLSVSGFMQVLNTSLRYHVTATSFFHQEMAERWVTARIGAPEGWRLRQAKVIEDSLNHGHDRAKGVHPASDSLATTASDSLATTGSLQALDSFREYADRFNRRAQLLSESLVFLLIPMLVIPFGILDIWRRGPRPGRGVLLHLVHATHVTAFWLLTFAPTAIVASMALATLWSMGMMEEEAFQRLHEPVWTLLTCTTVAAYAALSTRRVYRTSWVGAVVRGAIIGLLLVPFLQVYRAILFVVGFYTT